MMQKSRCEQRGGQPLVAERGGMVGKPGEKLEEEGRSGVLLVALWCAGASQERAA